MKLYDGEGMVQSSGLWCRQSRLWGTLGGLILAGCFVGAVFLARTTNIKPLVWFCAVIAAVVIAMCVRGIVARFRSTNWVMRVQSDGLWINLRPMQAPSPDGPPSALHVKYSEIDHVHEHVDRWSTPSSEGGSTLWKLKSLDLHLAAGDATELAPALAEARADGRGLPTSVMLPAPDVLRIAWSGHGHDVVPGLDKVLYAMRGWVRVTGPTQTKRADWESLSEGELEEQVNMLVRWGDEMEASSLLMRRRGCSATEAHVMVKELSTRI